MILQLLKMLHIHLELSTRENATGAIGDFGSFSFHEVKNITSCGEGGIVITNTPYG
jgi:dTDP-4-amino-4,6-dideoxygalactose transaminase